MALDPFTSSTDAVAGSPAAVQQLLDHLHSITSALRSNYIAGLRLEWLTATSFRVNVGAAAIKSTRADGVIQADGSGSGIYLPVTAAIDTTVSGLTASTLYHVYLFRNTTSLQPNVEIVTTAPVNYFGSAYQKTSDATRRYLGSIRTDGSSNLYRFNHFEGRMKYLVPTNASPFRVLTAGAATSLTNVSCAGVVPVTSRNALVRFAETGGQVADVGTSEDSGTFIFNVDPNGRLVAEIALDASQQFRYKMSSGAGALYADIWGYVFER